MNLTKLQTQDVLKDYLSKENGLNDVLEMVLNSLMLSERDCFLEKSTIQNKGNGYRPGTVFGRGHQLELRIPRDRMGQFYPVILSLLKNEDQQIHDLSFALYSKGLTTRDIGGILEQIYGRNYSKSKISSINTGFYEQMEAWRNRDLDEEYLVVFGRK